jgi:hypothetical protein
MSREKIKAREKITRKISKSGVVERNAVTGEEKRVSKREAEFDLRGETPQTALWQSIRHGLTVIC